MSIVIDDPVLSNRLIAQRTTGLGAAYKNALGWDSPHKIYAGVNISDREENWEHNFRCPDNRVLLEGNPAKECATHRCGAPDFLDEILSKGDRSRKKLPFYAKLGVREVLLIDRYPWALELYRLREGQLQLVGRAIPDDGVVLASD